ncbi:MAG: hypothetical protein JRM82_01220 [Nitrososphaerota archaeon]|nr:hypothetical protein [Nitrososphaerota archaeon]
MRVLAAPIIALLLLSAAAPALSVSPTTAHQAAKAMVFTIVVSSPALNHPLTFTASRPYNGTEFYGTYTQMEFQPCCNQFPIQDHQMEFYRANGLTAATALQSLTTPSARSTPSSFRGVLEGRR